ncbi:hypothetical protein Nepgr_026747 [Nepenthes gracilis]|uniref:DNA polymerase delta subunit 3 n=1 Tax=Nepenthes gracilis TaxID=150966 RepID=A0AAD3T9L3_NEPGR|nr:hypothetical protein Nepgr_026747 [Nepenthes gracilis]
MPEIETLGILEEIEALVSDRLQVVSFKWLSRNFLVSSNAAKKLLEEFVGKHGKGLEVVYSMTGWLKRNPPTYHARLVPAAKLAEAKQDFDDNCSVQVYSVQACIPKDPAALWNAEFVQAEELFKQSLTADNCLKDNRFSGVSNQFVKCHAEVTPSGIAAPQTKCAGVVGLQKKLQSSPAPGLQSCNAMPSVKSESDISGARDPANKPALIKEGNSISVSTKRGQNGLSSSGSGGSLVNLFGRASTKLKSTSASAEANSVASKADVSAEAQICAHEAFDNGNSDDDGVDINFKRASNGDGGKKRRVVLDDSDEEGDYENAVSLASPDSSKGQPSQYMKQQDRILNLERNSLNFDYQEDDKTKVKEEKANDTELKKPLKDSPAFHKGMNSGNFTAAEAPSAHDENEKKVTNVVPVSPKRRKVLKTRIDERGREVTEVVWEGEETQVKNTDSIVANKARNPTPKNEDDEPTNPVNRPAAVKKSPAAGGTAPSLPAGKAGNKKEVRPKDPKQGNIMSFFKRV